MATEVVQFREDSEALAYLRGRGVNPNEFAREAFEANLRKIRAQETAEKLSEVQADLPRPVAEIIREARDSR